MNEIINHILKRAESLSNQKLAQPKTPEELKDLFDLDLGEDQFEGKLTELVDNIINYSVNTQNPRFLNQLYGGSSQEAWLGEFLTAILNTSMATYEIAPLATMMELELIKAMNQEIGFDHAEGLFVPGGSYANMLGINLARTKYDQDIKYKGIQDHSKFKLFVSEDAHYSSKKSLALMGHGFDSLIKIKVDKDRKMDLSDLKNKINKVRSNNEIPLAVISTAGTTVYGAFDPIAEIQKICEQENLWHHVDAAWGGLALWSKDKNQFFKGIDSVDSITLDFHKLMASTLTKGIFITSHPELLKKAHVGGGGKYIFHDSESIDTGQYAIQCGRKVDSLPLWLQWKLAGTKKFRNKISEFFELKNWLVDFLKSHNDQYKLVQEPEFLNFCFQVLPKDKDLNISEFNFELRKRLMARGNFMVNFSQNAKDGYFIRLVFNHWGVNQEILSELFQELAIIEKEITHLN